MASTPVLAFGSANDVLPDDVLPRAQFWKDDLKIPTIWGYRPVDLHDLSWTMRGVRVIRAGDRQKVLSRPELFLLTGTDHLVSFRLRPLLDQFVWARYDVLSVRLRCRHDAHYSEVLETTAFEDNVADFVALRRQYRQRGDAPVRVALTRDRELADLWRHAADEHSAWVSLRAETRSRRRGVASTRGSAYSVSRLSDQAKLVDDLVERWTEAGVTLPETREICSEVRAHETAEVDSTARFLGPVWIGAGRNVRAGEYVLGPAVLWDVPDARPCLPELALEELDATSFLVPAAARSLQASVARPRTLLGRARASVKRLFDVVVAATALIFTLPVFPLVLLAIWLEDGRPFFFGHQRETRGNREFTCWKFRSMRKNAEQLKESLQQSNKADGPQFYIENDPRLTRVGSFLRATNIDEIPQFWNVLVGHMAVVGPRPSPHVENQFCPEWREARLSVRPGVTGLWQVMRTRNSGQDFQEWIRYDLIYVYRGNWKMDLDIIFRTARLVVGGKLR